MFGSILDPGNVLEAVIGNLLLIVLLLVERDAVLDLTFQNQSPSLNLEP